MAEQTERTLLAAKHYCVELVRLLEAIAVADSHSDEEFKAAMNAFWDAEAHICRCVMMLLPADFPDGHLRRDAPESPRDG